MIQEPPEDVARPDFRRAGDHEDEPETPEAGSDRAVRSEMEEIAREAERLVREGVEQTERYIRRHPLAAVGIAAGLGVLIGLAMGRDR